MADSRRHEPEGLPDVEEIARKVDPESRTRQLGRAWGAIVTGLAIALSLFQIYTAAFGEMIPQVQRGTHVGLVLAIAFLLYAGRKGIAGKNPSPIDVLLALGGLVVGFYQVIFAEHIIRMAGDYSDLDLAIAGLAVLLVLEATRRVIGWPLVLVAIASMAYAFLGPYLPGPEPFRLLAHAHRQPILPHDGGHYGHPDRGVLHLRLHVHPVWGLPSEVGPGQVLHRLGDVADGHDDGGGRRRSPSSAAA